MTENITNNNITNSSLSFYTYIFIFIIQSMDGFFQNTPVSSTNKTADRGDKAEILLKVALKIITLTPYPLQSTCISNTKLLKNILQHHYNNNNNNKKQKTKNNNNNKTKAVKMKPNILYFSINMSKICNLW